MTQPEPTVTTKMRKSTHSQLRLLAALTGESMLAVLARLVLNELQRVQAVQERS